MTILTIGRETETDNWFFFWRPLDTHIHNYRTDRKFIYLNPIVSTHTHTHNIIQEPMDIAWYRKVTYVSVLAIARLTFDRVPLIIPRPNNYQSLPTLQQETFYLLVIAFIEIRADEMLHYSVSQQSTLFNCINKINRYGIEYRVSKACKEHSNFRLYTNDPLMLSKFFFCVCVGVKFECSFRVFSFPLSFSLSAREISAIVASANSFVHVAMTCRTQGMNRIGERQ